MRFVLAALALLAAAPLGGCFMISMPMDPIWSKMESSAPVKPLS